MRRCSLSCSADGRKAADSHQFPFVREVVARVVGEGLEQQGEVLRPSADRFADQRQEFAVGCIHARHAEGVADVVPA